MTATTALLGIGGVLLAIRGLIAWAEKRNTDFANVTAEPEEN